MKIVCNANWIIKLSFLTLCVLFAAEKTHAQQRPAGVRVQLPTTSFFNIRTVVSAPDAGITKLGGVSRGASTRSSYGIPGLSNIPWLGRSFRNRALAGSNSANNSSVLVRIISNKEIEEDVLSAATAHKRRDEIRDPNGSHAIQAQADFLSRNIGRRNR